ncbi:hypothetical protein OIN60_12835 [Paenibacillus sp. P96]|uniref:Uncharacterized protein n=1 Tax=Paenibacillus zeirhizosphaerae TaxID=2987519 RepID=A0ABT9FSE8_9BACL|nr:hypothetical protein [Paenibacillus sp. P96]MDP4097658.1 hypothetical protein [Paenibacillus sp. P96]
MKLDVFLLNGYTYCANLKSIPVVVRLSSTDKIEIAGKIDLREILLLQDGKDIFGGYIKSRLGMEKDTITISYDKPQHILYDICDYEDSELHPGEYEVSIKLQVYRYESGERKETVSLEGMTKLTIM